MPFRAVALGLPPFLEGEAKRGYCGPDDTGGRRNQCYIYGYISHALIVGLNNTARTWPKAR